MREGPFRLFVSASLAAFLTQIIMLQFEIARINQINNGARFKDAFYNLLKEKRIYRTYGLRLTGLAIKSSFIILFAYLGDDHLYKSYMEEVSIKYFYKITLSY